MIEDYEGLGGMVLRYLTNGCGLARPLEFEPRISLSIYK
jgi:hypothetical protein